MRPPRITPILAHSTKSSISRGVIGAGPPHKRCERTLRAHKPSQAGCRRHRQGRTSELQPVPPEPALGRSREREWQDAACVDVVAKATPIFNCMSWFVPHFGDITRRTVEVCFRGKRILSKECLGASCHHKDGPGSED